MHDVRVRGARVRVPGPPARLDRRGRPATTHDLLAFGTAFRQAYPTSGVFPLWVPHSYFDAVDAGAPLPYPHVDDPYEELLEETLHHDPVPTLIEYGTELLENMYQAEFGYFDEDDPPGPHEDRLWIPAPDTGNFETNGRDLPTQDSLVLVPVSEPWEALLRMGWNPGNAPPTPHLIACLRHFERAYGAEVRTEHYEVLIVTRSSPPRSRAEAWQCMIEVLGFGDGQDGSLSKFTSGVLAGDPWTFWWD